MAGTINLGTTTLADGSTVAFEASYNDSLQLIELRCDNKSPQGAFIRIAAVDASGVESKTAVYGESFPPGVNIIAIPTSPANAIITIAANPSKPGKYTGFNVTTTVPG